MALSGHQGGELCGEGGGEMFGGEACGVAAQRGHVPAAGLGLLDGGADGGGGGDVEEEACLALADGLERAAGAQGQDGRPGGLRLHGHDAEVFHSREEEAFGAGVEAGQLGVGHAPEEGDVGWDGLAERAQEGAVPGDDEAFAKAPEGLDEDVGGFVGNQGAEPEPVVAWALRGGGEAVDRDGWVDHGGLAAVDAADAIGDEGGVGHEAVDALGAAQVVAAQGRGEEAHGQATGQAGAAVVVVGQIPEVAHGGVAVAEVAGVGRFADALDGAGLTADEQVEAREVPPAKGERHEGEVGLATAATLRQVGDEALVDGVGQEVGRDGRTSAGVGVDRRLGEPAGDGLQHLFAAAHGEEPIMEQGRLHGAGSGLRR